MAFFSKYKKRLTVGDVAHRYIDMWAFMGVHPANIDLLKRLKTADDRQFTTNMDVCGTVSEQLPTGGWAQTHLVGIRTDVWQPNRDAQERRLQAAQIERQEMLRKRIRGSGTLNAAETRQLQKAIAGDPVMKLRAPDIDTRRLVLKLFRTTGDRVTWTGSIEEMMSREVHNSLGSQRSILSFASSLAGLIYMTNIQENHRTFRIPSIFTFSYVDERDKRLWYIKLKRKWVSIGADFTVETEGRRIGLIDGALIGFGYNAHLHLSEPRLARNTQFLDLLTLFAATVGYQSAMRRSVRRRVRSSLQGLGGQHLIEDEELKLLRNPRVA